MKALQLRYEKVSADEEGMRFRNRPNRKVVHLIVRIVFFSLKVL